MSDIKCIIVEDEPLAAKILSGYIEDVPFLSLEGTFKNALDATEYLQHHKPDLIFLDIHLPKLKGMAFLKTLTDAPAVVITTAYHEYAVEGFNLNVTDYLLKPFEFERFMVAVNKVNAQRRKSVEVHTMPRDHIFINVQKKKVKLLFDDILYIESQREYIRIVTRQKEFLTKMSTNEIEDLLPPTFKRIHRSFIVSVAKINSYTADTVEINGTEIPIGKGYRDVTGSF